MILQALTQYYEALAERGEIARPGWAKAKVRYALCIDGQGDLQQLIPLLEDKGGKKPQPQQIVLPAPVKRASGVAANFLWDNAGYLLGLDDKGKPERSAACFAACRALHHELLDGMESETAQGILAFLDRWDPAKAAEHPPVAGGTARPSGGRQSGLSRQRLVRAGGPGDQTALAGPL